jgi:EAL domain-containing protein (putative c-di-GMP-specific phosphodiesterase class I)
MAFQPIVDMETGDVFAQEALVRGPGNEPAGKIFRRVNDDNRYQFDQACRVRAIELAASLGMESLLSINFMPNAVYQPERCIRTTLQAAEAHNFPIERIIFEITESEKIEDHKHLRDIVLHYQERGFLTAIDDFGAGYSGLGLLAELQTDLVKLDMALIRDIHRDKPRQAIVRGTVQTCDDLGIRVIAEGVESREELETLRQAGIRLFQGYYFARPAFEGQARVPPDRLVVAPD